MGASTQLTSGWLGTWPGSSRGVDSTEKYSNFKYIIVSKDMATVLNRFILPIGGVSMEKVCYKQGGVSSSDYLLTWGDTNATDPLHHAVHPPHLGQLGLVEQHLGLGQLGLVKQHLGIGQLGLVQRQLGLESLHAALNRALAPMVWTPSYLRSSLVSSSTMQISTS